jgi:hypothetical protein
MGDYEFEVSREQFDYLKQLASRDESVAVVLNAWEAMPKAE